MLRSKFLKVLDMETPGDSSDLSRRELLAGLGAMALLAGCGGRDLPIPYDTDGGVDVASDGHVEQCEGSLQDVLAKAFRIESHRVLHYESRPTELFCDGSLQIGKFPECFYPITVQLGWSVSGSFDDVIIFPKMPQILTNDSPTGEYIMNTQPFPTGSQYFAFFFESQSTGQRAWTGPVAMDI